MTTSEPDKHHNNGQPVTPKQIQNPNQRDFGFEQFLDVAELTRLANEFMSGVPGSSGGLAPGNTDLEKMAYSQGLSSAGISESDLRRIPEDLARSTGAASSSAVTSPGVSPSVMPVIPGGSQSAIPAIPGTSANAMPVSYGVSPNVMPMIPGVSQKAVATAPSTSLMPSFDSFDTAQMFSDVPFGFFNDIRPLLGLGEALPIASTFAPSSNTVSSTNQLADYGTTNLIADSSSAASELSTPLIPGASHHTVSPPLNISNAETLRQTSRIDVIPVVEPFSPQVPGSITNLGISSAQPFDVAAIRRDFPILQQKVNGHDLIWLDNAATTQKPQSVIDRLVHFYKYENSNIHRAAHELAARSTDAYEAARESVRRFLNAPSVNEIVFVRGATEAINLVAQSWGRQNIQKDDEIVITWLEHHANIVPWQMLCAEKGARLRVAPVDDHGQILLNEYERLLGPRTKLVALTQVSNALGTVTPLDEMITAAHRHGARVLVDGAQAVSHMHVDVQQYDCDFYVLSGHKLFAPTGIGVLFGKTEVLDSMQPWQGGGNMIQDVTFERTMYQKAPFRFEAGTGNIADAVGLGAAVEYLERIGMVNITRHENELMAYGTESLKSIPGLHMIGNAPHKAGILSFVLDGFRNEDVSSALNQQGIAVRAGHHCAQPILRRFGVEGTVRPSLALYNTCEDIDALIAAIWNLKSGRTVGLLQ